MRYLVPLFLIGLTACGGAKSGMETETADPVPVWEKDAENTAYEFYRSVANTLLRTYQPQKALQPIGKLIKLKPREPEPYYLMGRAYLALEDFSSARKAIKKALDKDKKYADGHSLLGITYNMTGHHSWALKHHLKAIELDDERAEFYNNLGFSYYLQKDYPNAIQAYTKALEIAPGSKRIHNNLGFAYGKTHRMTLAYKNFKLAGVPAQASNNMGFVYENHGNLTSAYEYYLLALKQDPALVQAKLNLKRVCSQLGRPVPEVEGGNENTSNHENES